MADHRGCVESLVLDQLQESSRLRLRQRWELASVLNFLRVFEPVIGKDLKMSAEEIEMALINPDASLARLHVTLLKGIPPVNKNLSNPDVWVTILCKKLAEWWPWVAEGEIPLTAAKGEEISRYKELDPTIRLMMLKALCELRTEQEDLVSYINDELKQGTQISHFRKDKIGEGGTGISYWYDGNSVIGHRLYREVNMFTLKPKHRGKGCLDLPQNLLDWETLATNLNEFRKVSEELSSSKVGVEAAVHKTIETEVIPVLEKLQKKKERDLKRRQREEALLNGYHSYAAGTTRSCRTRRAVKYTFDEYDRTIDEAIKLTRKRKSREEERGNGKHHRRGKRDEGASDGGLSKNAHSEEGSQASTDEDVENAPQGEGSDDNKENDQQGESSDNGEENDEQDEGSDDDEENDRQADTDRIDNVGKNDDGKCRDRDSSESALENGKPGKRNRVDLSQGQNDNCSTRLQTKNWSDRNLQEARSLGAKNRLRQRPIRNSAIDEPAVIPDSDSGNSSENTSLDEAGERELSEVADSEDETSS